MDNYESLLLVNDTNLLVKKMELNIETQNKEINNLKIEKKKLQSEYGQLEDIRLQLAIDLEAEKDQNKIFTDLNDELMKEIIFYKEIITNLARDLKLTENDLKKINVQNNDGSDEKRKEIFTFINKIMENYKILENKNIEYKKRINEYEKRINEYEKIQKQNDDHIKVQIEQQSLANDKANGLNIKIETMIKNYDTQILEIIDLFNELK